MPTRSEIVVGSLAVCFLFPFYFIKRVFCDHKWGKGDICIKCQEERYYKKKD